MRFITEYGTPSRCVIRGRELDALLSTIGQQVWNLSGYSRKLPYVESKILKRAATVIAGFILVRIIGLIVFRIIPPINVLLGLVCVLSLGMILVIYGTVRKNSSGINVDPV